MPDEGPPSYRPHRPQGPRSKAKVSSPLGSKVSSPLGGEVAAKRPEGRAPQPHSELKSSQNPGYDTATHSAPATRVSPSASSPATASATATRWSPCDPTAAPRTRTGPP